MGASFVVDRGVVHTNDFALINPSVEMTGRGDVDLSAQTLEFHFVPKAVQGLPGVKLVDIGVPFYVKGPWTKPSYGPDARALAKTIVEKLENGALLDAAEAEGFEIFVTADKNIRYQQNLADRKIAVVILGNAQWPLLRRHVDRVIIALNAARPGSYSMVEIPAD